MGKVTARQGRDRSSESILDFPGTQRWVPKGRVRIGRLKMLDVDKGFGSANLGNALLSAQLTPGSGLFNFCTPATLTHSNVSRQPVVFFKADLQTFYICTAANHFLQKCDAVGGKLIFHPFLWLCVAFSLSPVADLLSVLLCVLAWMGWNERKE